MDKEKKSLKMEISILDSTSSESLMVLANISGRMAIHTKEILSKDQEKEKGS